MGSGSWELMWRRETGDLVSSLVQTAAAENAGAELCALIGYLSFAVAQAIMMFDLIFPEIANRAHLPHMVRIEAREEPQMVSNQKVYVG